MSDNQGHRNSLVRNELNSDRRKLLKGAMTAGIASFAPAVLANGLSAETFQPGEDIIGENGETALSGKLICSISDPIKTLVLSNHTGKTMVIENVAQGAFMYDGSIVDCNTACLSSSITISPNQQVEVQFDKRKQLVLTHRADEFRRIQSRVTRLNDGTRIIPFSARVNGTIATIV